MTSSMFAIMSERNRAYDSYAGFLREAIRDYWESKRGKRINFLALLFASQQAWGAAWDEARDPETAKKVLTGAAGAAAVGVVLRMVLGGPIGLVLTAASMASLVALYVRNHTKIMARQVHYREVINEYRPRYDSIVADCEGGKVDESQRDLMIDGLMRRFLDELDAYIPPDEEDEEDWEDEDEEEETSAFREHIARKQSEEE